jgi:O-antigen/teichoic acid export membrane protein
VLDQGLVSGSNFLMGVLLARLLPPDQFGAYALAFSCFLLISMLHQALLLEPQKVFGASVYLDSARVYLGTLLWFHATIGFVTLSILSLCAWISHQFGKSVTLPGALAGAALASPCILLFWLLRGAVYVDHAPERAVKASLSYAIFILLGLAVICPSGLLSPFSAFCVMGCGALIASAGLLIRLRPLLRPGGDHHVLERAARQHWKYGCWALGTYLITWINGDIYYPLVSLFGGVAAAGALKALINLGLPVAQVCTGLSQLLLPYVARKYAHDGGSAMGGLALRITFLFSSAAGAYWAVIMLLKVSVFNLLYGGKYIEVSYLLPWVALISIFANALSGPATALRAMQLSQSVFIASCAACVISITVGIPAVRSLGVGGVMPGMVLATFVPLMITAVMLSHKIGKPSPCVKSV